jgi:hypothetical protein
MPQHASTYSGVLFILLTIETLDFLSHPIAVAPSTVVHWCNAAHEPLAEMFTSAPVFDAASSGVLLLLQTGCRYQVAMTTPAQKRSAAGSSNPLHETGVLKTVLGWSWAPSVCGCCQ